MSLLMSLLVMYGLLLTMPLMCSMRLSRQRQNTPS